jgi:hypothetical protein
MGFRLVSFGYQLSPTSYYWGSYSRIKNGGLQWSITNGYHVIQNSVTSYYNNRINSLLISSFVGTITHKPAGRFLASMRLCIP